MKHLENKKSDLVFSLNEIKDFLKSNKGHIKNLSVRFDWGKDYEEIQTLKKIGEKLIDLSNLYNCFSINRIWLINNSIQDIETQKKLLNKFKNNEVSKFDVFVYSRIDSECKKVDDF